MSVSHVEAVAILLFALLVPVFASDASSTSVGAATPTPTATPTSTSAECSISRNTQTVITDAAQASSLAVACPLFTGTINVDASEDVSFDGMNTIDGDFIARSNSRVSVISSNSISNITGTLSLVNLPNLTVFDFPNLLSAGTLELHDLPATAKTLSFFETLHHVGAIDIQSTALSSLEGFNVSAVDLVDIKDNTDMTLVNLGMTNATNVFIGGNSAQMDLFMPNLRWVHNLTLENCSSVSIPSLTHVNDTLHLAGNSFSSFGNTSVVRTIDNTLWINNNMNLTNISLPELRSVGGHILINNNPKLTLLGEAVVLESIGGSVQIDGEFSSISFPALTNVSGGFALNSTINLDCSMFDTYYKDGKITGNYTCTTPTQPDNPIDKTKNTTATHTHASHVSDDVKIGIGLGIPLGCLVIAAIAALCLIYHTRKKRGNREGINNLAEMPSNTAVAELDIGGSGKLLHELGRSHSRNISGTESRHELHSDSIPGELVTPVEDDSHYMDVIIGNFELEGDTVYAQKAEDWA